MSIEETGAMSNGNSLSDVSALEDNIAKIQFDLSKLCKGCR